MKPDIKGLTKLAQVLGRVPRKEFDMQNWWLKTPCGTTGCIAGWAAHTFPSRFKKVVEATDGDRSFYEIANRRTGSTGESAFADGFYISEEDAYHITLKNMSWTPKQAAKAVMSLVGRLKKESKSK